MGFMTYKIGDAIARSLQKPISGYEPFTRSDPDALRASLRSGDVLLFEGNNRISGVIKYLTQSTWSHAALYVGSMAGRVDEDGEPHVLVEVAMSVGVVSAPLSIFLRSFRWSSRPSRLASTTSNCTGATCRHWTGIRARDRLGAFAKNREEQVPCCRSRNRVRFRPVSSLSGISRRRRRCSPSGQTGHDRLLLQRHHRARRAQRNRDGIAARH